MALIKCSECGADMSDKAKACPKCGFENNFVFCTECGKKVSGKARMCPDCGAPIQNNETYSNNTYQGANTKSKVAAALLAIFLGTLGIHNFYLGYTGRGLGQLFLTIFGWIIIVGPLASAIWALVDFILILTNKDARDAHGNLIV